TGSWFPDGFHGTMGELLSAIEEKREPTNSARNNLDSLALCFAAVASADRGEPVVPGSVRTLTGGSASPFRSAEPPPSLHRKTHTAQQELRPPVQFAAATSFVTLFAVA